jgi:CheY-like chemotaxis protein
MRDPPAYWKGGRPLSGPPLAAMARKKILVVEDNEDNRRILVYRLRKIGEFEIREATNGLEALDQVQRDPPHLIFMDLKMPVMDGWEATRRIREMAGGDAVRIIALTAQAMEGDEEKALAIGCDDYLAKPVVDPSLVREKLVRLLGVAA